MEKKQINLETNFKKSLNEAQKKLSEVHMSCKNAIQTGDKQKNTD